jgi:hypothetical protein
LNPRDAIVKFNLISPENEVQRQKKEQSFKSCTELLSDQSKQFLLNEFCELNEF